MLTAPTIVIIALLYLCLLFAIAYYGDKRADRGQSIIGNPYIYALSIAVYCTSWTFYGSVGRAVSSGVGFLPIYIGPTLTFILGWYLIRKIIRISKVNRITSIADFIAARYGKSALLGGLVTVIAVIGIIPYIALQLKAVSNSFTLLLQYPDVVMPHKRAVALLEDTALYVALLLAAFTIVFGTRHLDATERHEGMVAAIAFESLVKLLAFLAVGAFVTFGLYDGFADVFEQAMQQIEAVARAFQAVPRDRRLAQPGRGLQVLAGAQQDVLGQALRLAPVGDLQLGLPFALGEAGVVGAARLADAVELVGKAGIAAGRVAAGDRGEEFVDVDGHGAAPLVRGCGDC